MRTASRPSVWFWILVAVVAIAAAAAAVAPGLYRTAVLGSGFLAQRLCGDVFISASGTICAFRASGCSTHSPCKAR